MPDSKIQERTAEALREVATKRKCPTCGERRIDVNIIKKKYRVWNFMPTLFQAKVKEGFILCLENL